MTNIAAVTEYHAKLIAFNLVRRLPPDSSERLAVAGAGAQVDMSQQQVAAAFIAIASPLSKGACRVGIVATAIHGHCLSFVIGVRWTPAIINLKWFSRKYSAFSGLRRRE